MSSEVSPHQLDGPSSQSKRKRGKKDEDGGSQEPEKKNKACHACRRVKLRCVIDDQGGPCRRCAARREECIFTTPLHDLRWQETVNERVDHLSETMQYLLGAIQMIAQSVNVTLPPPPARPSPAGSTAPTSSQRLRSTPLPSQPKAGPSGLPVESLDVRSRQSTPSSLSLRQQGFNQPDFYLTQSGAEELLAQAYAPLPAPPLNATISLGLGSTQAQQGSLASTGDFENADAPALFGLLESYLEGIHNGTDLANGGVLGQIGASGSNGNAFTHPKFEIAGSEDPRPDVVKCAIVAPGDADVLLDFFHAHMAPHLCGFSLKLRSWPYLPTGKAFITPLILTSICMLAAERIPRYHDLCRTIAGSDLGRAIVDATPGLAFAPGQDGATDNGLEPDLDLELGIGPEEITALLLYASFSSSPRSDIIAHSAFEWTRGYLKTFMLPSPPQVTYGEVFGLLTARRSLTFENWLRLWLFGYVVDVQQSLHHESRTSVIFDPHFFCDSLLMNTMNSSNLIEQQYDRELVAHARLCAILQRIQHTRAMPGWASIPITELVATYEGWHKDLDQWCAEVDLGSQATPDLSIVMFRQFGRMYVSLAAAQEPKIRDQSTRLEFQSRSVVAAHGMLTSVKDDSSAGIIGLLHPFYIKIITLAAVVLLDAFNGEELVAVAPGSLKEAIDTVSQIALYLSRTPVPNDHICITTSVTLGKIVEKASRSAASHQVPDQHGGVGLSVGRRGSGDDDGGARVEAGGTD